MKVYEVKADVNEVQWLIPDVPDAETLKFSFDCSPKLEWSSPEVYPFNPLKKKADFLKFGTGGLLAGPKATEGVRTFFEMAGELLPLSYDGDEYTLLNVLECVNALDNKKTEWALNNNTKVWIKKYHFHEDRFSESPIFKIAEARATVLAWERDFDPECEFKACVEANGLTGLIFEELWDSENTLGF